MRAKLSQAILVSLVVIGAALVAHIMIPYELMARTTDSFDFSKTIPDEFGRWKIAPNVTLVEPGGGTLARQIYSQELGRGYSDDDGHLVMVLIAYGLSQNDRLQLHRPEVCYSAQGFRVSSRSAGEIPLDKAKSSLRVARLVAQRELRFEPITYWMRVGNEIATGVIDRQIIKFKYGLQGIVPDGALVRVSTVGLPKEVAYKVQAQFIRDLLATVSPETLRMLTGLMEGQPDPNSG